MRPVYTHVARSVVRVCVCPLSVYVGHTGEPCVIGCTARGAVSGQIRMGPRISCLLDGGARWRHLANTII